MFFIYSLLVRCQVKCPRTSKQPSEKVAGDPYSKDI